MTRKLGELEEGLIKGLLQRYGQGWRDHRHGVGPQHEHRGALALGQGSYPRRLKRG